MHFAFRIIGPGAFAREVHACFRGDRDLSVELAPGVLPFNTWRLFAECPMPQHRAKVAKAKARARRQRRQGGKAPRARAQRLHADIFDPRVPAAVPTAVAEGKALPVSGIAFTNGFVPSMGNTTAIFASNTGRGGTVYCTIDAAAVPVLTIGTIPTLALSDTAGGPTSGRAMKFGLSVLNRTQRLNQGGGVHVLNFNQRMDFPAAPSAMTQAQWGAVFTTVRAHPNTVAYNGDQFHQQRTFVAHPTSTPDYNSYGEWVGTQTADQFFEHLAVWAGSTRDSRPMSTIAVIFDSPAIAQTYDLRARGHYYTRWPLSTILGQNMKHVPTADIKVVNSSHIAAEESAQRARVQGAALGAATTLTGSYVGRLMQGRAGLLARAAGYAAEFGEGLEAAEVAGLLV